MLNFFLAFIIGLTSSLFAEAVVDRNQQGISFSSKTEKKDGSGLSPQEEFASEYSRVSTQYKELLKAVDNSKDAFEFDGAYHNLKNFIAFPGNQKFSNHALCSYLNSLSPVEIQDLENILTSSAVHISLKSCLTGLLTKMNTYNSLTRVSNVEILDYVKKVPFEVRSVPDLSYLSLQGLSEREVMLTFDDGPTPSVTSSILKTLDKAGVKAAFFSTGIQAQGNKSLAKEIVERGHVLGSHSYTHTLMMGREVNRGNISYDYFLSEFIGGHLGVYLAAGYIDPFFRFPNGCMNTNMRRNVNELGLKIFGWNIDTFDWQFSPRRFPRAIERKNAVLNSFINALKENRNRGIILMHDIGIQSAEALPLILNYLAENNFKVVLLTPEDRADQQATGNLPLVTQAMNYIRKAGVRFKDLLPPTPVATETKKYPDFIANVDYRGMFPQMTYENSPIDPLTSSCKN